MQVQMSAGILIAVFIAYMVITALVMFLLLFKKGKLTRNPIIFSLTQCYIIMHTILRFTTASVHVNEIVGRVFAVILSLGAVVCTFLNIKKNPLAGKISCILIVLSIINVWML